MAHFAKLDENNVVLEVNVVNDNDVLLNGVEVESAGIDFLTRWSNGYTNWKQTSYNRNFRKNYAGIGYTYDAQRDAFIPPQPFPSWTLDENTCLWQPPALMPTDVKMYDWDEETLSWTLIE